MKMGPMTRKVGAGAVMLLAAAGVSYATGCPAVVDSVWQAGMESAGEVIAQQISQLVSTVSTAREGNLQRLQSALKVLTKQVEVSGEKIAATQRAAKEASASSMVYLSNRKAILDADMNYNPVTGQGFDPCAEQKRSQNIAVAVGEANASMSEKVLQEIDAAPGRFVNRPAEVVAKRLNDARTVYCTADQKKAGFCSSEGAMAGMDADAAHFFTTYRVDSQDAKAKSQMLNYMFGVPATLPDKSVANTPAGRAYFEAKRTEDAYRSVSQASFKALQSWTESRGGNGEASDSVLGTIAAKVGTYSGGDNYAAWERAQATQSERGLMVELAKMRAFELYMRNLEYQQYERIEANLATMLALRARGALNNGAAESAAARMKVN